MKKVLCDKFREIPIIDDHITKINIAENCDRIGVVKHSNLKEITVSEGNKTFRFDLRHKVLVDKNNSLVVGMNDSTIPDYVTSIGARAFHSCKSLRRIAIPDSVKSLGGKIFFDCDSLECVIIPDSITRIEKEMFSWCLSLKNIILPESVTSIGYGAFYCCESLECITIPESVTCIEEGAFDSCISLECVTIKNPAVTIGEEAFDNCHLITINIPKGSRDHFEKQFPEEMHEWLKEILM